MSKPWSGVPSRALGSDGAERAHPTAARIARVPRRFDFLPKVRSNLLRKLDSRVDKRPFSALERVLNAYRMAPECAPSGRRTRGFDAFPRGAVDLAEPSALSRRAGSAPPPGGLRPFTDSQPQKRSQALGRRRGASRARAERVKSSDLAVSSSNPPPFHCEHPQTGERRAFSCPTALGFRVRLSRQARIPGCVPLAFPLGPTVDRRARG